MGKAAIEPDMSPFPLASIIARPPNRDKPG